MQYKSLKTEKWYQIVDNLVNLWGQAVNSTLPAWLNLLDRSVGLSELSVEENNTAEMDC